MLGTSKRPKVCILTSIHSPFDVRIFHKQAKTLVKGGYDVTLVAPYSQDELVDGIRIKAVPKSAVRASRMTRTVWHVYQRAVRSPADIYHFHVPELIPVGLALKAKGKKVIYDAHEYFRLKILSKDYIPSPFRRPLAMLFDRLESIASESFDGIIVVDGATQEKFRGKAVRVENFPYLPENIHSVRPSNFLFTIVYAGGLTRDRGLFQMIEALKFIKDPARLLLIGEANLSDRRKAEGIEGYARVEWLGYRPWPEALGIVAASHVGLAVFQPVPAYLYAGENTTKLFEYMLFGLPVVASNFPNLKVLIEREACGVVVDPTSPKAIAMEITRLMKEPDLLLEIGKKGAKAVGEKYHWRHAAARLLGLYTKVLAG